MNQMQFDYYYGLEGEQFTFVKIPKMLLTDAAFQQLSDRAKILYGVMLDRMSLSRSKEWVDKQNRVYILFSIKSVCKALNCSKPSACKAMAELDTETGIGLVERRKRGQGKPDIIYVKNFISYVQNNPEIGKKTVWNPDDIDGAPEVEPEDETAEEEVIHNEVKNVDLQKSKSLTSKNLTSKSFTSGGQEDLPLGVNGFAPNNTNNNKTEKNNTESSLILSESDTKSPDYSRPITLTREDGMRCDNHIEFNPDYVPTVVLDLEERVSEFNIDKINDILEENNGIPIDFAFDPDAMKYTVMSLTGWNYKRREIERGDMSAEDAEIYVNMVRNLIEMAICVKTPIVLGGKRQITYKNVNDQMNKIYHSAEFKESAFERLMIECIKRYKDATIKTQIMKVDPYCKSLIWSTFDSYQMDFNGFFNRTYYGDWKS